MENQSIDMLLNDDATRMTITMKVFDSEEQDLQTVGSAVRVEKAISTYLSVLPRDITVNIWGDGNDAIRFSKTIMDDQTKSTVVSFVLVFIITLISFSSVKYGLFSVIPILIGIMTNYIIMFLTGIPFDLVTIGFSSVTVGVGIDDALHFLIRYNNKRKDNPSDSIKLQLDKTIRETGRPIILTTLSIVTGLAMLSFGSYTPIRYFGILVSVSLITTMLATLFILPPVIIATEIIGNKFRKIKTRL
jgi:hypothetical protein